MKGKIGSSDRFYFIFSGSSITMDMDCSHEKKKSCLWKKSCDKPRKSIKKQRPYFVDKGPYSQAMVFPIVIYGWENWMINKAENQRTDALNYGDGEDS